MKARLQWMLCLCLGLASLARGAETDFLDEAKDFNQKYQPEIKQISSLAENGDFRAADRQLVALAKKTATPGAYFIIGNMLFQLDPADSYTLHQMAYQARPRKKLTTLEWAMEQHRRGEYAKATALYQAYFGLEPEDDKTQALLADCLVRTGKYAEAVKAWDAANHADNHDAIDQAIFDIYGGPSAMCRRMDLVDKLRGGDGGVAEKLIFLDLNFDDDWWNKSLNLPALKTDLALAKKILANDAERFEELSCYAGLAAENLPAADIKSNLVTEALLIGDSGRLPKNSLVAQELAEMVVGNKIETSEQLLRRHQTALEARAKSAAGDSDALNLLCFLCVESKDARLAEFDKYGWDRYGEERFAVSYLEGLLAANKLSYDGDPLRRALKQFPEDTAITMLQLRAAGEEHITAGMIESAIKAQYRKLSFGMAAPDSYTLKGLFNVLGERLNKTKPANS